MSQDLCNIQNMLFEMAASVRHLSEEIESIKQQTNETVINALKTALHLDELQQVTLIGELKTEKDERKKAEKVSPTPLSKEKKESKKKKNPSSRFARVCPLARPRDCFEVQNYLEAYCKRTKRDIPDKLDGETIFDILNDEDWLDKNGKPITDWKKATRKIIRFRSDNERKDQKKLKIKLELEKLRHQNIMNERGKKTETATPHIGHVEVNKPVFQDRKGSCPEDVWIKLQKAGYTFEQLKELDKKGLPMPEVT